MDDFTSRELIKKIEYTLKEVADYNFSYDFRTVLKYYTKLGTAFGYGDEEQNTNTSTDNDVYTTEEEPKATITIQRLYRWNVWESYGTMQQSGMSVKKDTVVNLKDAYKVLKKQDSTNNKKKEDELLKFKNRNK